MHNKKGSNKEPHNNGTEIVSFEKLQTKQGPKIEPLQTM